MLNVGTKRAIEGQKLGRMLRECPLCASPELTYEFIVDGYPVCGCSGCRLLFLNPGPESDTVAKSTPDPCFDDLRAENARTRLDVFCAYAGVEQGRLLCIGCDPAFEQLAEERGFTVTAITAADYSRFIADSHGSFDSCVCYGFVETLADPIGALQSLRILLTDTAAFMAIVPTLDSGTASLFGPRWWEFRKENHFYFATDTFQTVLLRGGFGDPVMTPDHGVISLNYLQRKLESIPRMAAFLPLRLTAKLPVFRSRLFRVRHSRTCFLARPKPDCRDVLVSVVMPVYNERLTVAQVLDMLLAKRAEGMDMEIIVVESNSTDGTRDVVLQYQGRAGVRIVLQEAPRGKGNAVRQGLRYATGDVIIIQDADLEYDLNDYDALLEPILHHHYNFVIGIRHGGPKNTWKIRQFEGAHGLALLFNFGHLVFLTLFNMIYKQKLTDPFSMFKVFRRDCLAGMNFTCDRFDFDFELVIKLLRKGYRPLEIPVNYRSRALGEGKKVTLIRDPLTWLRALWRFRKSPLYAFEQDATSPSAGAPVP